MTRSSNKVAIVTGASRGIGTAIAKRLAHDGFAVAVNYASDTAPAEEVVADIKKAGGKAMPAQADISDPAAVRSMFDAVEAALGGLDVIVNNAGIMKVGPITEVDDDTFDRQIAINLKGVFNGMREAARRFKSGGRIISLSSSVVGLYHPNYSVYAATKGAVEAMTHVLSRELRGRNITVNAIAPGPTATDLFLKANTQESIERLTKLAPLERLGRPEDIAAAIAFLAGPDGAWINGQVLRANGGII